MLNLVKFRAAKKRSNLVDLLANLADFFIWFVYWLWKSLL